jgi:hypothetical protein
MRKIYATALALAAGLALATTGSAQMQHNMQMEEQTRAIAGGGIKAAGWQGQIDANEAKKGAKLEGALLEQKGSALHVATGPAVTYWKPEFKASGNYTVKATFTEPQYMNLNDHPHPYGIIIGGNDLGSDQMSLLYCTAYGNGSFIVRGFGPEPFRLGGQRPTEDAAVNKASAAGQSVKQDIAVKVSGDKIDCIINGKTVASYPKSDAVGAGKLKSTDGIYGIRFGHNTEGEVTGLTMTKD